MSKSVGEQYERLLTEAWARYDDDPDLRAWPVRCRLARWLRDISAKCCLPGVAELRLLDAVVCAMRTCDQTCVAALLPGCDPDKSVELMTRARRELAAAAPAPANECDADGGRLRAALVAVDEQCVGLEQFFRDVAAHTCDRGALLMHVTGLLLAEFRVFVDGVFGNRVSQIGAVLAREQMAARDRYAALECRVINRAQLALLFVRDAIPEFNWSQYFADPVCYIRSVVPSRCPQSPDDEVSDAPTDDGDPDMVEDVQGKALLYQLNWLRSEIDRAECESHTLQEQHSGLTAELGAIDDRMGEVKCQTADREAKMSAELNALRARSAQQVCVIDKLMETIHMAIQNKKSNPAKTAAADDKR